jgi:hypothetical protein
VACRRVFDDVVLDLVLCAETLCASVGEITPSAGGRA